MADPIRTHYELRAPGYALGRGPDNVHTQILARVGSGRRVLDVGCGAGLLGAEIRRLGNHVTGLEISTAAAGAAADRLDRVIAGSLEDDPPAFPAERFDVIVCADVLEHLFAPEAALARLVELLEPSGRLFVSLPNVAHLSVRLGLLAGRWEYEEEGLLERGHIRFFTFASAERMLAGAGLEARERVSVMSLPNASPLADRLIRLGRRLPADWREALRGLLAAQMLFVAERA